jgi:hypothetical protein
MSEDNTNVNVQTAKSSVNHRNIDAAGEDHPFGSEAQEFTADLRTLIRRVADELYESWEATIREYLANAETACLRAQEYVETGSTAITDSELIIDDSYQPKVEVVWDKQEDKVTIQDNGIGMSAETVDEVFRQIGRTTGRDEGQYSGNFGQGVLSFVKVVGLDNAMIMTSNSRVNGDNAAYYVTLAGVEPIMGSLPDDQYGTKFQMTPQGDFNIRDAVETYAEWMRVPVRYEEVGQDGSIVFQEDYGDKSLFEEYEDNRICLGARQKGAFEAYASPDADARTLLLSMNIDRNDGKYEPGQHEAPFPFDVRLLDESGKVIESSSGNEGLMPTPRSEYEGMLKEARHPYISEELLNQGDVLAQELEESSDSRYEDGYVVSDDVYEKIEGQEIRVPPNEYLPKSDVREGDVPGDTHVISGPHKGKVVVAHDEWESMDAGRASMYVPEDELEEYDLETGEGDLTLPKPTSDRDRLQSHRTFWKYVGRMFGEQFDEKVDEVYEHIDSADDALDTIMQLDPEEMVVNPEGFDADSFTTES